MRSLGMPFAAAGWRRCRGDGKLGYIAGSDYNPTKPFTFQGREYPPAVDLEGKDSGPDSATPRASITPRPSDAGEEGENDGDGGDGNNNKTKKGNKKQNLLGLVVDGEEAARRGYEKLVRIIAKYDTRFRFTQAYTPQQNGMEERRIRMVMEKAICLLFDGHLSGALWGEAVVTSTCMINITPSAAIDIRSPYLLWHNQLPRITKLRTFGYAAYAWIPKDKRTKLEAHAVKCIFVGYDEADRSGYRLLRLLDCEAIHSRDVRFNEAELPRFADRVLAALPDER
ncbi:unnamed protein product [Phytophthora fragariaefolia]|uniref:Unnamed protein product n=1 Tax=Phytophthora fragariaefolia TaxID=1490495 RepID=A0A9W6TRS5_9STRA|nr:unnamed protein product [Phytophthora fragariaefolia]